MGRRPDLECAKNVLVVSLQLLVEDGTLANEPVTDVGKI